MRYNTIISYCNSQYLVYPYFVTVGGIERLIRFYKRTLVEMAYFPTPIEVACKAVYRMYTIKSL